MSTATVETHSTERGEERPMCTWKVVLLDSLEGRGTSYDPSNLTLSAYRCLWCDGFSPDCCSYTF